MLRLLLFVYFITLSAFLKAQSGPEQRFVTRGEPIEDVLTKLVNSYSIDLVYDPEMDLSDPVFVDVTSDNPSEVLREVLKNSPFDFIILSTGTYVITKRKGLIQRYGSFIGYVLDEETGQPISNASILFADASTGTFTNEEGFFSMPSLLVGTYPVTVSSVGYSSSKKTITVKSESGVNVIRLSPKTFIADPIIVNSNPISLSNGKMMESIDEDMLHSGGSTGSASIIRSLSLFSGVSFNHTQDELSIQGGDPSNYMIRLDGVDLYNTSRSGNLLGMFSPYAIEKINVQKAAYDASYGGSLSGSIDFSQSLIDRSASKQLFQADPYSLNLRSEFDLENAPVKISLTGRVKQLRKNNPDAIENTYNSWNSLDPLIQNFLMGSENDIAHYHPSIQNNDIGFNDFHLIAEYKPDEFNTTTFSGYFGNQKTRTQLLSERITLTSGQPDFVYSQEDADAYNVMSQVTHYRILRPQTDIKAQLSFSANRYRNVYYMDGYSADSETNNNSSSNFISNDDIFANYRATYSRDESLSDRNEITDVTFLTELTQYFSSQNRTRFGLEIKFIDYNFELKDLFYFPTSNSNQFGLITSYASNKFTLSRNFWLEAGLRSTYSSSSQRAYLLPRASITFDSEQTRIGFHTLNLRAGIYRQFINQFDIANVGPSAIQPFNRISVPVDESINTPVSYQSAFSWSIMPSDKFRFSLDAYYKIEPQNYEINFLNILTGTEPGVSQIKDQEEFLSVSEMNAYGGAFSIEAFLKQPQIHFKLIQQTNISKQKIENRFNSSWNHTSWSEPFSSSAFINLKASKNISLIYNFRWIPTRYWAFSRSYYDFLTTHNENQFGQFDINDPDNISLDDYFRMDLSVNITVPFDRFNLSSRVDLVNLTNRSNEVSYHLTPVERNGDIEYQLSTRTLNGFLPSISFQIDF